MEPNKKYDITQIDYIRFLFIEYSKKHNIESDKIYDPLEFFKKFRSQITTKNEINKIKVPVMKKRKGDKCCSVAEEKLDHYNFILDTTHDNSFGGGIMDFSLSVIDGEDWLAGGSGDGFSRWMLWDSLAKMPPFYFAKLKE